MQITDQIVNSEISVWIKFSVEGLKGNDVFTLFVILIESESDYHRMVDVRVKDIENLLILFERASVCFPFSFVCLSKCS